MARKEKVSESTSTVQSQRSDERKDEPVEFEAGGAQADGGEPEMELVADPGPVKKIVFPGEPGYEAPEPEAAAEAAPSAAGAGPRGMVFRRVEATDAAGLSGGSGSALHERSDSIYSIRDEVDQLRGPDPKFPGAPPRANLQSWKSTTVYRTEQGGEVRSHEGPMGKSITLSDGHQERRFSEAEVDRVIANVDLGEHNAGAAPTTQEEESPQTPQEAPAKQKRGLFGFARRRKEEAPAEREAMPAQEPAAKESEYQPQCSAITEEGLQCRNSARGGSKYCSSHFGFQPRTAEGILQATDTAPRHESSHDTAPGGWDPGQQGSAQCIALTRNGKQCQNPVVAGSPFCGSHQGAKAPTARSAVKSADTKPRWSQAKDTKPATRKPAGRAGKAAKASKAGKSRKK